MISDRFRAMARPVPGAGAPSQAPAPPPGGGGSVLTTPQAEAATPAATDGAPDTWGSDIGQGVLQGLRTTSLGSMNLPDPMHLLSLGLLPDPNQQPGAQALRQRMEQQSQAFQESPEGQSIPGMLANVGTQIATTAPFLGPLEELVPAAGVGANFLTRMAAKGARGAIGGAGFNALTGGDPLAGGVGGGILGAVLPGGAAVNTALQGAAKRLGIDLTAGQQLGGVYKWLEGITDPLRIAGGPQAAARTMNQIGDVIRNEAGLAADHPLDLMNTLQAMRTVGQRIDTAAASSPINAADPQLWNSMANNEALAQAGGVGSAQANYFDTLMKELQSRIAASGTGRLEGADLAAMIQKGRPLWNARFSADPEVARVGNQFYSDLMQAAENTSPGGPAALSRARYQYKVLATALPFIAKTAGGEEGLGGLNFANTLTREFLPPQPLQPGMTPPPMIDLAHVIRGTQPARSSGTSERLAGMAGMGAAMDLGRQAFSDPWGAEAQALHMLPFIAGAGGLGATLRYTPGLYTGLNRLLGYAPRYLGGPLGNPITGATPGGQP